MTTASDASDGRAARHPPRSLIVSVCGAFLRDLGGWIAVADLIRLLADLDVEEQAVRSAVSRLKRRGLLEPETRDGAVGYRLGADAADILAAGDRRIFRERPDGADAGWVLVVFSVPEERREQRHVLRSRLTWLGFGNAAPGVWVAPAHLADEARDVLAREGLDRYASIFRGEYLGFAPAPEAVASWWDLAGIEDLYRSFLATAGPVLARWDGEQPAGGPAFADYVRVLTDWRRLPYLDPGLPPALLPAAWDADRAARLFADLRERLAAPALAHVRSVTVKGPSPLPLHRHEPCTRRRRSTTSPTVA